MPPVQLMDYTSLGMGDFDTPIVRGMDTGIDTPPLTFDDPMFTPDDLPDDILSVFGWESLTPPLDSEPTDLTNIRHEQHYSKLMHSTDFVPGLMWDQEFEPFTPPTTPPASPLQHSKCPEAPMPRGFSLHNFNSNILNVTNITPSLKSCDNHIFKVDLSSNLYTTPNNTHIRPNTTAQRIMATKKQTKSKANKGSVSKAGLLNKSKSSPLLTSSNKPNYTAARRYSAADIKVPAGKRSSTTSKAGTTTYNTTNNINSSTIITPSGYKINHINHTTALNNSNNSYPEFNANKLNTTHNNNSNSCLDTPDGKRKTHNVLERKRRNDLKNSYQSLREQLPDLAENRRAPTGQILTLAVHYISQLQKESNEVNNKLAMMRAENLRLKSNQRRMSR